MAKLESISEEPSSDYPKAFLSIMDKIEGPYAFLYFHVRFANQRPSKRGKAT